MAWETVKCSKCGESYSVQMYGPRKTREWKINSWRGICDDCKEAERENLIEKNKSGDMPELTGSEKQIAWAMKIRAEFINYADKIDEDEIEDILDDCKDDHNLSADPGLVDAALAEIMETPEAHWWIDSRNDLDSDIVVHVMVKIAETVNEDPIKKDFQAEAEAEAVIRPTTPVTETIAEIRLVKDEILTSFRERNDDFREIVKNHGYRWNDPWRKKLSFATDDPIDRLAEIGHYLLAQGYPVQIMNEEARAKAISGDFEPEHTRWISVLTESHPDSFYISWEYEDNMYDAAKRITGSRYSKPGVVVPMEHVDEILDFAEIYKYRFSPAAEKMIEQARANQQAAQVVDVVGKSKPDLPEPGEIPDLDIPELVEIDDELKD